MTLPKYHAVYPCFYYKNRERYYIMDNYGYPVRINFFQTIYSVWAGGYYE